MWLWFKCYVDWPDVDWLHAVSIDPTWFKRVEILKFYLLPASHTVTTPLYSP
jgi:hypothetical protein